MQLESRICALQIRHRSEVAPTTGPRRLTLVVILGRSWRPIRDSNHPDLSVMKVAYRVVFQTVIQCRMEHAGMLQLHRSYLKDGTNILMCTSDASSCHWRLSLLRPAHETNRSLRQHPDLRHRTSFRRRDGWLYHYNNDRTRLGNR